VLDTCRSVGHDAKASGECRYFLGLDRPSLWPNRSLISALKTSARRPLHRRPTPLSTVGVLCAGVPKEGGRKKTKGRGLGQGEKKGGNGPWACVGEKET